MRDLIGFNISGSTISDLIGYNIPGLTISDLIQKREMERDR